MIKGLSHAVITTDDVASITKFFSEIFSISPHFSNADFSEFVLPNRGRIAFFRVVGKAKEHFAVETSRKGHSFGVTVEKVDEIYQRVLAAQKNWKCSVSGPPKDHPWGERSFLLIDPDDNRWEVTQSPSQDGFLIPR